MKYVSTRGKAPTLNFEEVLLAGLASDGGLYLPDVWPKFSIEELAAMRSLPYNELAFNIMQPFVSSSISDAKFKKIVDDTYKTFNHKATAPLIQLNTNEFLLELFHGPTLAFKDFALQLLGRLLDYFLTKRGQRAVILGATSGDTGSAAIEGCKHSTMLDIFIMHPHNKISEVQRKQMTTVIEENVFNIAINGTFDDCQELVKQSFAKQDFLNGKSLIAINSINFARIMAQIVYYFYAALALGSPSRSVSFCVPTGNFGDIFAGFAAYKMGLPINQLIVATNKNAILHNFFSINKYHISTLMPSISPSMDIMVSSNFERLLFEAYGRDSTQIAQLMLNFKITGKLSVDKDVWSYLRYLFDSYSVDDESTIETMNKIYQQTGYTPDPHTAIGIKAAQERHCTNDTPMIILATAHISKFSDSAKQALINDIKLPPHIKNLYQKQERLKVLDNDLNDLHTYISNNIKH